MSVPDLVYVIFQRCGCSSVDRVLASEAKGRGFDPRQPHHLLDSGSLRCLKQTSCCRKMAALLSGRGNKLVRLDVDLHEQRGPHLNFMGIAKAHCASCAFTSRCAIDVRQLPGTASKTEASMRSF